MRKQKPWKGQVETDLKVKQYPMKLRWSYTKFDGQFQFVDVSREAVWLGFYDLHIHKAIARRGDDFAHDEMSAMRDFLARYIEKYDSRLANIDTYSHRLVNWGYSRVIRVHHQPSGVHTPYHIVIQSNYRRNKSHSLDQLWEESGEYNQAGKKAQCVLDEVADYFTGQPSQYDDTLAREIGDHIKKALSELSERERYILVRRLPVLVDAKEGCYAVGKNTDGSTFNELAKLFGVNRERIRQIQNSALGKVRTKLLPVWRELVEAA